jgi:rhodanese-related sulfurtransferase
MRALLSTANTAVDRLLEYAGNHPWLASAAVVAALAVIAFETRARAAGRASVAPQELVLLLNRGTLVLDIRPPELFAAGHIGGSRHLPSEQILKADEVQMLKKHKEKPIVVYDDSGSLGAAAVRQLVAQGFTRALNLRGGLAAWRAENLPVVRN